MLLEDFYSVENITPESGSEFCVKVKLNPQHNVYEGHFPGNPIVPGVCQLQMLKEIIAERMGKELTLSSASNIKYLNVINPLVDAELMVKISVTEAFEEIKVKAEIAAEDGRTFFKFKGVFHDK